MTGHNSYRYGKQDFSNSIIIIALLNNMVGGRLTQAFLQWFGLFCFFSCSSQTKDYLRHSSQ